MLPNILTGGKLDFEVATVNLNPCYVYLPVHSGGISLGLHL